MIPRERAVICREWEGILDSWPGSYPYKILKHLRWVRDAAESGEEQVKQNLQCTLASDATLRWLDNN